MTIKNTSSSYGSIAKLFHWSTAFVVICLIIIGFNLSNFNLSFKFTAYMLHKSTGILILAISILRAIWMMMNPKPKLPTGTPFWEIFTSHFIHFSLYVLLIAMPLSGWVMSCAMGHPPKFYGLFSLPLPGVPINLELAQTMRTAHYVIGWCLIIIISIHVLAAFKHHLIDNDDVLRKMLPKY